MLYTIEDCTIDIATSVLWCVYVHMSLSTPICVTESSQTIPDAIGT